ncbi:hypothetical protein TNCV_4412431 [Trichonephila clavipes]|nr:hypothetical protein TNCV_4412431 [Trichonephila clavipes]
MLSMWLGAILLVKSPFLSKKEKHHQPYYIIQVTIVLQSSEKTRSVVIAPQTMVSNYLTLGRPIDEAGLDLSSCRCCTCTRCLSLEKQGCDSSD